MAKTYVSYYDGTKKYVNVSELASPEQAGLMSPEDKKKLDALSEGSVPTSIEGSKVIQDSTHRFVTDVEKNMWTAKADNAVATAYRNGLLAAADKAKLDSIDANANYYVHPDTHEATMIRQDATHRFVSDAQITLWNSKAPNTLASQSSAGLMSAEDKQALDSLKSGGGSSGGNVSASNIIQDDEHRFATSAQLEKLDSIPETIDNFELIFDENDGAVTISADLF